MRKKAGILTVAFIMLLCMLCIWPFALVRKDAKCETQSTAYLFTNQGQSFNTQMEQTFIAQESVLRKVGFAIHFTGEKCEAVFQLKDGEGKVLTEQSVQLEAGDSDRYCYVDAQTRLKKGNEYHWSLEIQNAEQIQSGFLYIADGEIGAAGNENLYVDGVLYEGQAVTSYTYGAPLNVVNILCLWAFVLMAGSCIPEIITQKQENSVLKKAEELLTKYQNIILAAEILIVTALVVRSCFTQAVDWDEAYT